MDAVDAEIRLVRALTRGLMHLLSARLAAGAPLRRIHGHYFARAQGLLEDAEIHAIAAATGDALALEEIRRCADGLRALTSDLEAEFPAQRDPEET